MLRGWVSVCDEEGERMTLLGDTGFRGGEGIAHGGPGTFSN